MKKLLFFLFLFTSFIGYSQQNIKLKSNKKKKITASAPAVVVGNTFFVSASGNNSNDGRTTATPWRTLSKVQSAGNAGTIAAGDRILFKRGESFSGTIMWATVYGGNCPSGTASAPITFSTYGSGPKPKFQNATSNGIFWIIGPSYIVINGLNITDTTFDVNDKINPAPCQNGIRIGEYNGTTSNHCTIKNCDFSNIGGGIVLNGNFNLVDSCSITDLKNVQNTYSTTFPGNDNDYGANSLTITGNDNLITHCYLTGAWAESEDYGWNGGAFEMFDNCNRNKIMYCTINDCGGISEYGAFAGAATAADNLFAYNKIINCGNLSWVNTNGTFAIQASNIQYFNNDVIENSNSRFSGPNTGAGVITPRVLAKISPEPDMLAFSGTPAASVVYNLKNNIFNLTTGIKVVRSSGIAAKTSHTHNIYKFSGGSTANMTLTGSEISTAATIWTNTTDPNPGYWDLTPITGSPAINFGTNVSITRDFNNVLIDSIPDAGCIEYLDLLGINDDPLKPQRIRDPFLRYDFNKIIIKATRADGYAFYNVVGQRLLQGIYRPGINEIDIRRFSQGLYYLVTGNGPYKILK